MMPEEINKKRGMVKVLLDALKNHAGKELEQGVGGFSQKKEMTHTPVPKGNVADTPHKKESFKASESQSDQGPMPMEGSTPMAKGGMVDLTKEQSLMQPTSEDHVHTEMCEGGCSYADGGMPLATDEPDRVLEGDAESRPDTSDALANLPEAPTDEQSSEETQQDEHNKENEEEDQNNNSSSFDGFFKRKKKK